MQKRADDINLQPVSGAIFFNQKKNKQKSV